MMHRPFAAPSSHSSPVLYEPVVTEEPEYPSIDEFLDELPPIENYLAAERDEEPVDEPAADEDWITAGWNSYDFSSLSEIANRTPSKASRAVARPPAKQPQKSLTTPGPSAEEVASALDGIAHRIRSGELVIDSLHGMPPEAAMAAAIAALLRMRE